MLNGYKLIIVGLHDHDHKFHPVSFTIVLHENTEAYIFVFASLKKYFHSVYKIDF